MRLGSIAMTVVVVAGLAWWFVLRHDTQGTSGTPTAQAPAAGDVAAAVADTARPAGRRGTDPVRVAVIDSRAEPATSVLSLRGQTAARREVTLRAETEGLVVTEPIRAGARVAAGQVLCGLESGSREAELAEAEAELARAAAEAEAADSLSAQGFTARTTRIARQAALEAARAELNRSRLDIERLTIEAPFAGQLESDTAELGTLLKQGDACASVVDLSALEIVAFVSERDVDRLAVGQVVGVRLVNGETREGRIGFIAATADPSTRTYRVEAVIPNPEGRLRDGMTAEIRVEVTAGVAHRLPQSVLTLDDRGRLGVRTVEDGVARFVAVRLLRDSDGVAWVDGLAETAQVIALGQEFVTDGRPVIAVPMAEALARPAGIEPAEPEPAASGPGPALAPPPATPSGAAIDAPGRTPPMADPGDSQRGDLDTLSSASEGRG
ncbi:MAG: efflux RND transporter periplasmic adaptor subunit [Pseudomonadota bacterium]